MTQRNTGLSERHASGLEARDVELARGQRTILKRVSLSFPAGAATLITGPNGAGKSTLLKTLSGLLPPVRGAIVATDAAGAAIEDGADAGTRRQVCCYFAHANGIKGALTAAENLDFWRRLYGTDKSRTDDAAARMNLNDFLTRRAETLSAGQRRRLGFARVLVSGRPVWLLDEPTASVDAASSAFIVKAVADHRDDGGCAIVATHDAFDIDNARRIALAPARRAA
ncbi:MAG: heme ABC exporter ATP-binding protein CcmA [Pseudomonadota bacterium]